MKAFLNADYVQLQSPVHGTFIHASEDGKTVRLDALQMSQNAMWAVERQDNPGIVLLRGAYGRYLGAPDVWSSLSLCPRVAAAQLDFDKPEKKEIMWSIIKKESTVELKSESGPFLRPGVSIWCKSREWKVHLVPRTCIRPPPPPPCVDKWPLSFKREIHWLLAERSCAIIDNDDDWGKFSFIGRDRSELEDKFRLETKGFPMSIFVRAGRHGTPTPLCVNLPRSQEPIYVIGFWGAAATDRSVFPNTAPAEREMSVTLLDYTVRKC